MQAPKRHDRRGRRGALPTSATHATLFAGLCLLWAHASAATLGAKEHKDFVRGLAAGETVGGPKNSYYWRIPEAVLPTDVSAGIWYLHTGTAHGAIPAGLLSQMTTPDGAAADASKFAKSSEILLALRGARRAAAAHRPAVLARRAAAAALARHAMRLRVAVRRRARECASP